MEENARLLIPALTSPDPFGVSSILNKASPPRPPRKPAPAATAAPTKASSSPFFPFSHWASSITPRDGCGDGHLSPYPLCQLTPASPLPVMAWVRPPTAPSPTPPQPARTTSRRTPLATTSLLQPPPSSAPRIRRSTRASKTIGTTHTEQAITPSTVSLATPVAIIWTVLPSSSPPIDKPAPPLPLHKGGKRKSSILKRNVAAVGTGGVGERALAERLFPPTTATDTAAAPKPAARRQPQQPAKHHGKQGYLPVEKGRHLFRLLMAHYSTGDWSSTLSDAQADAIAAQAGCTAQQVRKKRENVLSRYCSSAGQLQTSSQAVKLVLNSAEAAAPTAPAAAPVAVKQKAVPAPAPMSPPSPWRAAKRRLDSGAVGDGDGGGGGGGGGPWCSPVTLRAPPDAPKKRRAGPPQPKSELEE